jgi:IclR family pca regulon transcriptional regulator
MEIDERSRDRIQSIERGVEVLRVFGGRDDSLTVSAIAALVDLPRPVVRRILITYEHLGYARAQNGVWSLTPRILELGAGYFGSASLPEISYPVMGEVVEATSETCSIGVLDSTEVIHVARVEERRPMPDAVRVGTRLPAHATAGGKAMLAHLAPAVIEEFFEIASLERFTPQTITDEATLRARLELVRSRGYDVSIEELHPGMSAAAVPIMVDAVVIGALTVSSTTVRASEESFVTSIVPVLRDAADRIARTYRAANPQLYRAGQGQ